MSKRIFKTLTLAEQVEVFKKLDLKESQSSIAQQFGINQSAISRIQKNKDKIIQESQSNSNPNFKWRRTGKSEDVEEDKYIHKDTYIKIHT